VLTCAAHAERRGDIIVAIEFNNLDLMSPIFVKGTETKNQYNIDF